MLPCFVDSISLRRTDRDRVSQAAFREASPSVAGTYKDLRKLISRTDDFAEMRIALRQMDLPGVPHLVVCLSDLDRSLFQSHNSIQKRQETPDGEHESVPGGAAADEELFDFERSRAAAPTMSQVRYRPPSPCFSSCRRCCPTTPFPVASSLFFLLVRLTPHPEPTAWRRRRMAQLAKFSSVPYWLSVDSDLLAVLQHVLDNEVRQLSHAPTQTSACPSPSMPCAPLPHANAPQLSHPDLAWTG